MVGFKSPNHPPPRASPNVRYLQFYTPSTTAHHNSRCTQSDSYDFFNLLTGDVLLNKVEVLSPKHRERLFAPTETLSLFLAQAMSADSSCQKSVNQAAIKRLIGGLTHRSTHTGGYCRARQRLLAAMICDLTLHLVDQRTTGRSLDLDMISGDIARQQNL